MVPGSMKLATAMLGLVALCASGVAARRGLLQSAGIDYPNCGLGAFWSGTGCAICPRGRYQDDPAGLNLCKSCSAPLTTCCPGAASSDQCASATSCSGAVCTPPTGPGGLPSVQDALVCPAGYYKNAAAGRCDPCSVGSYSEVPGAVAACTACPAGTSTCCPGSTSRSECDGPTRQCSPQCPLARVLCPSGHFLDLTLAAPDCRPCRVGQYNDAPDKTECSPCGSDETTCCVASQTSAECVLRTLAPSRCTFTCAIPTPAPEPGAETQEPALLCKAGYFWLSSKFRCEPCAAGTYTDSDGAAACKLCPAGRTLTCCTGSTSESDCKTGPEFAQCSQCFVPLPQCPQGYSFNTATRECTPCAVGTFNDAPDATECSPCGADETTCCRGQVTSSACVKRTLAPAQCAAAGACPALPYPK